MTKIRTWLKNLVTRPRLLDCGWCYEERGEEVHPHPECPIGYAATGEQYAPVDWQAIVERRERELRTVGEARHQAETRIKLALDVIHEWQRDGPSNDYLTRVHRALNPPVSGNSTGPARP